MSAYKNNNHLIGQLQNNITSHDGFQSPIMWIGLIRFVRSAKSTLRKERSSPFRTTTVVLDFESGPIACPGGVNLLIVMGHQHVVR